MVKDQAVIALIDKKDKFAFLNLASKIRHEVSFAIKNSLPYEGHIISEFWNQCNKKHNDHAGIFQVGNKRIELEDVSITKDLPVTIGLQSCINFILGLSSNVWRYCEVGNTFGSAEISDTGLYNPVAPRIDMTVFGTKEPIGMNIRFLAVFGETHPATTISECGVFNQASGPLMLNHNVFPENPLIRIFGQQVAVVSSIVEFCPKA